MCYSALDPTVMASRFRTQLVIGVASLVMIAALGGILGVVTLYVSNRRAIAVTQEVVDDLTAIQLVRVRAEQVVSAARGYLLTGDAEDRAHMLASRSALEAAIDASRRRQSEIDLLVKLAILEQRVIDYAHATAQAVLARTEGGDLSALVAAFEERLEPRRTALDDAAGDLVASERAKVAHEALYTATSLRQVSLAMLLIAIAGVVVSMVLAVLVIRRLSAQYRRIADAEHVAEQAARNRKELLDIVAHDLLSPLNSVVLGLEVLEIQHGPLPRLGMIRDAAERMQRLIDDLVDTSRAELSRLSIERVDCSIAPLVDALVAQLQLRARRADITLQAKVPSALVARVDGSRVQQILANLVGNAIRVSPAKTRIEIAVSEIDNRVRFCVADEGPGIPAGECSLLFGAYQHGTQSRGRLGLGLYICKTLVDAQGGTIGVESQVGRGSTFWFELPRA